MLTGWPSELSSLSGGAGSCGLATLPRYLGVPGSELEEPPPQAATPSATAVVAMAIPTGAGRGRIRSLISVNGSQTSVKTAIPPPAITTGATEPQLSAATRTGGLPRRRPRRLRGRRRLAARD